MTTITYGAATATRAAPAIPATAPKRKNFLARFFEAFTEAQMRRAEREIRMHRHLLPADFELAANKLTRKNEDSLPFVR
ncbi:MAG: hypothetical protein M3R18_04565 [Pseudomonadota bacterium]|nr:hypothetical protein [Pseudomonadota bacterium]